MNDDFITRFKRYRVKKECQNYIIHSRDEYIEENLDITKYLRYGKLDDIIEAFSNAFDENIGQKNKKIFNQKIKKLKIYESPKSYKHNGRSANGIYNPKKNKIILCGGKNYDSRDVSERLMHELIHMASTKAKGYLDGITFANVVGHGYSIVGKGLNEGYTELLNSQYFAQQNYAEYYTAEKIIAAGIEKIVGKEQMHDIYFRYTFMDLLNELKKYDGDDEYYLNLIFKVDLLTNENDVTKRTNLYKELKTEIANIHRKKIKKQLDNKEIDSKEYNRINFFDIEMYEKHDFIYNNYAKVVEQNDNYLLMSDFGFLKMNKDDKDVKQYMKETNK